MTFIFLVFLEVSPVYASVGFRYLVFEVSGIQNTIGNGICVNEVQAYDSAKLEYLHGTVPISAYDSITNGLPSNWNNTIWDKKKLTDGSWSYASNVGGQSTSTIFCFSGDHTTSWARFAFDMNSVKDIEKVTLYLGNSDRRVPKIVQIYGTNSYSSSQVSSARDNSNLTLIATVNPTDSSGPLKYDISVKYPNVSTPSNVSVSGSNGNGTLVWSANPAEENVTSYKIYQNGSLVSTQSNTSFTFSGLSVGTYTFNVLAVNEYGESPQSTGVIYKVLPNSPIPILDNYTTSTAVISWEPVNGATSYDISINGNFVTNTKSTTYSMSSLLYNTSYTVSVIAKSSLGDSGPGFVTFKTIDLPSPPEGLQVTNITSSTLDLSWFAVSGSISYILDQNDKLLATTTNTFYHCSGLSPNTTYTYKVAVVTAIGESEFSNPVTAKTLGVPPLTPTGLSAGNIGESEFTVYWVSKSDAESYDVYLDGNYKSTVNQPLILNPSYRFSELNSGSTYNVTIIASNAWGQSTASNSLRVTTKAIPSKVGKVIGSNVKPNSLTLTWVSIPFSDSYEVQNITIANNQTVTDNKLTVTDLKESTSYEFKVRAHNDLGYGPYSDPVTFRTASSAASNNIGLNMNGGDVIKGMKPVTGAIGMPLSFSIAVPLSFLILKFVKNYFL